MAEYQYRWFNYSKYLTKAAHLHVTQNSSRYTAPQWLSCVRLSVVARFDDNFSISTIRDNFLSHQGDKLFLWKRGV